MNRRAFVVGLLSVFASLAIALRRAAAWTLITNDEFQAESRADRPEGAAPLPQAGSPQIEVLKPDASKPVKSPVTIRIRFRPQAGATINPATFRARYGWLGIDITDRIIAHAQIDASGLSADNAEIPPGQYSVTLEIADTVGRVGTRAFTFRVV